MAGPTIVMCAEVADLAAVDAATVDKLWGIEFEYGHVGRLVRSAGVAYICECKSCRCGGFGRVKDAELSTRESASDGDLIGTRKRT
jgi:hypothetical protein